MRRQRRKRIGTKEEGFLPIGDSATPFLGALNGAGYAIRGLQMRRAGEMGGFFGVVGAGGRISNLGVDGGEVEGGAMVGLLAAPGRGRRCYRGGVGTRSGAGFGQCRRISGIFGERRDDEAKLVWRPCAREKKCGRPSGRRGGEISVGGHDCE